MPKSRKPQRLKKTKKRRLVLEYWPGKPLRRFCPELQARELVWHGLITNAAPNGLVNEYTITPDAPMLLNEFIAIVREELNQLIDDAAINCGVRVYARV